MKRLTMAAAVLALMATSGCIVPEPEAGADPAAAPAGLFVAPSVTGVEPAGTGRPTGCGGGWGSGC